LNFPKGTLFNKAGWEAYFAFSLPLLHAGGPP
jgi:hypothetical protein